LPHPVACTFRFSQPHGALVRPVPAGLVSCRIRSWGCTLQSFPPLAWPYAVSGAFPLLMLGRIRRARLADVPTVAHASLAAAETAPHETRAPARSENRSSPGQTSPPEASPPSGVCSSRESATPRRLFRPPEARSSPGLSALQGSPPRGNARLSPGLPSWALSHQTRAADEPTLQGIDCHEIGWSLSRLPTLLGFAAS
jgi:hypothetical protein